MQEESCYQQQEAALLTQEVISVLESSEEVKHAIVAWRAAISDQQRLTSDLEKFHKSKAELLKEIETLTDGFGSEDSTKDLTSLEKKRARLKAVEEAIVLLNGRLGSTVAKRARREIEDAVAAIQMALGAAIQRKLQVIIDEKVESLALTIEMHRKAILKAGASQKVIPTELFGLVKLREVQANLNLTPHFQEIIPMDLPLITSIRSNAFEQGRASR